MQPTATVNLNDYGRGPPKDNSCDVWPKFISSFRGDVKVKILTHDICPKTKEDGQNRSRKLTLNTLTCSDLKVQTI